MSCELGLWCSGDQTLCLDVPLVPCPHCACSEFHVFASELHLFMVLFLRTHTQKYPIGMIFLSLTLNRISLFVFWQTAASMGLSFVSTPKWFILYLKLLFQ